MHLHLQKTMKKDSKNLTSCKLKFSVWILFILWEEILYISSDLRVSIRNVSLFFIYFPSCLSFYFWNCFCILISDEGPRSLNLISIEILNFFSKAYVFCLSFYHFLKYLPMKWNFCKTVNFKLHPQQHISTNTNTNWIKQLG